MRAIKLRQVWVVWIWLWGMWLGGLSGAALASDLLAITEDVPPFSYLDNGRYKGLANEVLDRISQRSGLHIQRIIQPWARGQKTLTEVPNSLLYIAVRSPSRENIST